MTSRRAGAILPLFSARSTTSWGIGELADIVPLTTWLARAGMRQLMLLPLGTMQPYQTSPYSATSTLAIDPIYISFDRLADFDRAGGVSALSDAARSALDAARRSPAVAHDLVRQAKDEAIGLAFSAFLTEDWEQLTLHAAALAAYVARERWWLDDYALFQALAQSMPGVSWRDWPAPLRDREPRAIDDARRQFAREVLRHQYAQWIADLQWRETRRHAREQGVALFGDLPFVASTESPEVWARADEFMLDVSAGAPPDAFSATGQDWGLPTYRWEAIAKSGYAWMRQRARRMAALFDGLRVDHVVGLYRTYGKPRDGEPFFSPADESVQRAQGMAVLTILRESGLELIAEDLGVVPEFVRESLTALDVPGCKVLRWERDWHAPGMPFLDPERFAALSAAMTGTHDTETLAVWWAELAEDDRTALLDLPLFGERGITDPAASWSNPLRDALIELAYRSGSHDVFLPVQDMFGWSDRINVPGTVGSHNWTWCLPWPVDRWDAVGEAGERAAVLRWLAVSTGRTTASDYTRVPAPRGAEPAS